MKRISLFLMSVIITLSICAQNSTSIKTFKYPDYLCPNPYGNPWFGGNTLEISYSGKNNSYGIEFKYGYLKYSLSLSYKGSNNGRHTYSGFEINNMLKTVVITHTKLSNFLNNFGQDQSEHFEKDKVIEVHVDKLGSLSIYPVKDTPERRQKIKEREEAATKERERNEVERISKERFDTFYIKCKTGLDKSLRKKLVENYIKSKGKTSLSFVGKGLIHYNLQEEVELITLNEKMIDSIQHVKFETIDFEYKDKDGRGIATKNEFFFLMDFRHDISIERATGNVSYNKNKIEYIYIEHRKTWPEEVKKIIETHITKKGIYSFNWEILEGNLLKLSYYKHKNFGFVSTNPKQTELYSIYK